MQTFLPYADFALSAKVLDYKRLGKQRVEAVQILKAIWLSDYGWQNHPATRMWRGYDMALQEYYNTILREWISRGYKNSMHFAKISTEIVYPQWLDRESFHASHRAALLAKDWEFYSQFGWAETPQLNYEWPI